MSFFKKVDKVFASTSKLKMMERTEKDTFIENRIRGVGIEKFATSEYGDLYLRVDELGGFLILETIIISATNFKSKKGSLLRFSKENETLEFTSDEEKIESEASNIPDRFATRIDYNLTEEEAKIFKENTFKEALFEINGKEIQFSVLK